MAISLSQNIGQKTKSDGNNKEHPLAEDESPAIFTVSIQLTCKTFKASIQIIFITGDGIVRINSRKSEYLSWPPLHY